MTELLGRDPFAFVPGAAVGHSSSGSTPYGSFGSRCVFSGGSGSSLGRPPLHAHKSNHEQPEWQGRPRASTLSQGVGRCLTGFVGVRGRDLGSRSCNILWHCRRVAWRIRTWSPCASPCSNPVLCRATRHLPSLGRPWLATTFRFSPRGGPGGNPHLTQPRFKRGCFCEMLCWAVGLGTDAALPPNHAVCLCLLGLGSSSVYAV